MAGQTQGRSSRLRLSLAAGIFLPGLWRESAALSAWVVKHEPPRTIP